MREVRWLLLVFALCLPIVLLAVGVKLPWVGGAAQAVPQAVPAGDVEVAWIHTTTNAATWERFVNGVVRSAEDVPGLTVDDSRAFLPSTTDTPEVVLSRAGHAGHVRIRWYKLQSDLSTEDWVTALAARTPAPVAVIGGGSTDRAIQLAEAMAAQQGWHGDRPPLLITTATADFVVSAPDGGTRLTSVYPGRTFRFCFTNQTMARAVIGFVFDGPETALAPPPAARVPVVTVSWADDRYSVDLRDQFTTALEDRFSATDRLAVLDQLTIPFSVGGYLSPNPPERELAAAVTARLRQVPDERVLLVLPGSTQPARRLLQAVIEAEPRAAAKLVVVTGDGIPLNAVLRDGQFAWPATSLPVPLVFFAHNNPVAWNRREPTRRASPDPFDEPNGTEEAMHFRKLAEELAQACFPPREPTAARGDEVVNRLNRRTDFFGPDGERRGGTDEHVVVVMPGRPPTLSVWRQGAGRPWVRVPGTPVPLTPEREGRP